MNTKRLAGLVALAIAAYAAQVPGGPSWAQNADPQPDSYPAQVQGAVRKVTRPAVIVAPEEFYFYDAKKMRTPLTTARAAIMSFIGSGATLAQGDKEEHLKRYNPSESKNIQGVYPRAEFQLGFLPTMTQQNLADALKQGIEDEKIDIAPVFMVEGREAIVDGMYIETTTRMSRETVFTALERYFGKGTLFHEVTPEGNLWHVSFKKLFFQDSAKLPLHTLSVGNIVNQSEDFRWVKRAYPKFHFLSQPVIATVSVAPVSGTVGEARVATLAIRIFGKPDEVTIDTKDIPEFFQGAFVPTAGGKPPLSNTWWTLDTNNNRPKVQAGPNEWVIVHEYNFGLFAPEPEWTIQGLSIPYKYRGNTLKAEVQTTTFFVRPHLDSKFALQDFPEAWTLSVPKFSGFLGKAPESVLRWFDSVAQFVGGRSILSGVLGGTAVTGFIFVGVFVGAAAMPKIRSHIRRRIVSVHSIDPLVLALFSKAEAEENPGVAFSHFHDALSRVLNSGFDSIPARNATYQDVKAARKGPRHDLMRKLESLVDFDELFDELEFRNSPDFGRQFDDKTRMERYTLLRVKVEDLAKAIGENDGGYE